MQQCELLSRQEGPALSTPLQFYKKEQHKEGGNRRDCAIPYSIVKVEFYKGYQDSRSSFYVGEKAFLQFDSVLIYHVACCGFLFHD